MGNAVSWGMQPSIVADPGNAGAIPVTEGWGVCSLVSAGAETRTLADPQRVGARISFGFKTDGGSTGIAITAATAVNQAGNTVLTFADAGDHLVLEAIEIGAALAWRVVANDGVALS